MATRIFITSAEWTAQGNALVAFKEVDKIEGPSLITKGPKTAITIAIAKENRFIDGPVGSDREAGLTIIERLGDLGYEVLNTWFEIVDSHRSLTAKALANKYRVLPGKVKTLTLNKEVVLPHSRILVNAITIYHNKPITFRGGKVTITLLGLVVPAFGPFHYVPVTWSSLSQTTRKEIVSNIITPGL